MNKLLILFLLVSVPGCATVAPLSGEEACASRGLVFQGMNFGSGRGYTSDFQGNDTYSYASSESLSCRVPANELERCEVGRTAFAAHPKYAYNDGIKGKRLVTGIGYVLYIIPGVIAKVVFDSNKNSAIDETIRLSQVDRDRCKTVTRETASQ